MDGGWHASRRRWRVAAHTEFHLGKTRDHLLRQRDTARRRETFR
jgi:hypothetical protein